MVSEFLIKHFICEECGQLVDGQRMIVYFLSPPEKRQGLCHINAEYKPVFEEEL